MKSKLSFVLLMVMSLFSSPFATGAQAPVVDLNRGQTQDSMGSGGLEVDQSEPAPRPTMTHQNEPMDQRVLRLERQISNVTEMNYASKFEKLQQELQQLQGQIEVQNHDVSQLKDQLRNFYQDLDGRLSKIQPDSSVEKTAQSSEKTRSSMKESTGSDTSSSKSKELQTYETAFNLLNKKEYEKAINGFQAFIKDYPESTYTVNAHYWLGEIYYLKDKPGQANKEFQMIINSYPENPKVADALLKVALIAMDGGNYTKAKTNLTKVQKQYPGTTAAKIATLRLKEIKAKQ